MVKVLPIGGTWAYKGKQTQDWWTPGSDWLEFLSGAGLEHLWPADPYVWSTHVAGTWFKSHVEWLAAGASLRYYLQNPLASGPDYEVPHDERRIVCHSHGLQPVLYACEGGLYIHTLISVGSPVREDMLDVAEAARPRIRQWMHIASPGWSDRMQWLGELCDGKLTVRRRHPLADVNVLVPGIGHSGVLRDPTRFPLWLEQGWCDFLKVA